MLEEQTKMVGEIVCRNVVGRRKFEEAGEESGGDEEFFERLEARWEGVEDEEFLERREGVIH